MVVLATGGHDRLFYLQPHMYLPTTAQKSCSNVLTYTKRASEFVGGTLIVTPIVSRRGLAGEKDPAGEQRKGGDVRVSCDETNKTELERSRRECGTVAAVDAQSVSDRD